MSSQGDRLKKLVAYITAGFPDSQFSIDVAFALKEAGVDTLELGIPFSDPVADGPVIEEANLQALRKGFTLDQLFTLSAPIAKEIDTLWMGYFNPFYARGFDYFIQEAKCSGIQGFIIPDLPHEESIIYKKSLKDNDLCTISFVAPTDSTQRIKNVVSDAQKFIYLVAYAGITGSGVSEDLQQCITDIRAFSDTPVYVGFGVDEKSAKEKAQGVDGVIVGSAFVKVLLDDTLNATQKINKIANIARNIKSAINE